MDKIDRVINYFRSLHEDFSAPTNSLSSGQIAGTRESGDNPPVNNKNKKRYIYQTGLRKWWKQNTEKNK